MIRARCRHPRIHLSQIVKPSHRLATDVDAYNHTHFSLYRPFEFACDLARSDKDMAARRGITLRELACSINFAVNSDGGSQTRTTVRSRPRQAVVSCRAYCLSIKCATLRTVTDNKGAKKGCKANVGNSISAVRSDRWQLGRIGPVSQAAAATFPNSPPRLGKSCIVPIYVFPNKVARSSRTDLACAWIILPSIGSNAKI